MHDIKNKNKNQDSDKFWKLIQSIMLDYELLANSHNVLLTSLFNKGVITMKDLEEATKQIEDKKAKQREMISKKINGGKGKSSIIMP